MDVLHISAECYPAAKAGGLGDVLGALPKYLNQEGVSTAVIIPKYATRWMEDREWFEDFRGMVRMNHIHVPYVIYRYSGDELGFPLYAVYVPGLFDRPGVYVDPYSGYGYNDELERSLVFQQAALQWVNQFKEKPKVIHCHDHHTGLVPFMMKHCPEFKNLAFIPSIFTIHNGNYQGAFSWKNVHLLPFFDAKASGLLNWNDTINPMATAIKCCWRFTTVSPSYMEELRYKSMGLEPLISAEWAKAYGILNGIDTSVWNPATDKYIYKKLDNNNIETFKKENKTIICENFNINPEFPLITFIGRLVTEKGADLLPDAISRFIHSGGRASFIVLGAGDPYLKDAFLKMRHHFFGFFDTSIEYNETLAHQLYAGSDFLVMPSRIEPCGLNQMYALRYGTVPIVRSVGGLRDTVKDIGIQGGNGIRFDNFDVNDLVNAFYRATEVFWLKESMDILRPRMMAIDNSWEKSARDYINIYRSCYS